MYIHTYIYTHTHTYISHEWGGTNSNSRGTYNSGGTSVRQMWLSTKVKKSHLHSILIKYWLSTKNKLVKSLSYAPLFATPWTVAYNAPLSVGFSRKEYWSGFHFLLQRIFLTQGSNLGLPHCRQMLYHLSHKGRSKNKLNAI